MSKQYPIQVENIPYNGKVRKPDPMLDELLSNPPRTATSLKPLGLVLVVFGVLWWLPAARTTVDGWVVILNVIMDFFGIAATVPYATGWLLLILAVVIGGIYSTVEARNLPIQRRNTVILFAPLMVWIGWLFLSTTDVASTFIGIMTPPIGAWAIHVQLASNPAAAAVLAVLSTFAPDWVIIFGVKMLMKSR
jgi:hypothetical protein